LRVTSVYVEIKDSRWNQQSTAEYSFRSESLGEATDLCLKIFKRAGCSPSKIKPASSVVLSKIRRTLFNERPNPLGRVR
jgi:hypothetical protein